MEINHSKINIQAFLMGVSVFLSLQPYFLWHVQGKFLLGHLLVWYVPMLVAFLSFQHKKINLFLKFFIVLLVFFGYTHRLGIQTFFVLCLSFIPFLGKKFALDSFYYFSSILAVVLSISLFFWIVFLVGIPFPHSIIEPINGFKQYNYEAYPMLVVSTWPAAHWRFHGPLDEPGYIGTICALALFIDNYDFKKRKNIILFVSGLLSMSVFFYVITAVYYLVMLTRHNRKWLIALLIIIPLFYIATKDVSVLDDNLYSRFEYDSSSSAFVGDSRNNDAIVEFVRYNIQSKDLLYGNSELIEMNGFTGNFSIYIGIIIYGLITIILYAVFFITYSIWLRLPFEKMVLFIILFVATLYQRPQLFDISFLFLFSTYIILSSNRDNNSILCQV